MVESGLRIDNLTICLHKIVQKDFSVKSGQANVYGDLDVSNKVTMGTLVSPTGTSDPGSPDEGQIYLNTSSDKVRVYVDGEWKSLAWEE